MWEWKDLRMSGAYHTSVNVICFENCAFCNIVLRERQFPLSFYGGTVSEVDCKFSHWVTCISQRRGTTAVFAAL